MMDQPLLKRCGAELLGTFWLVFGGCGTAVFSLITRQDGDPNVGLVGVSLAFGLTVLTGVYAFGHISGGHFNPAVTIGLAVGKRFAWKDVPQYVIAQLAGSIGAIAIIWLIAIDVPIQSGFQRGVGAFASNGYRQGHFFGLGGVLTAESVLTFMFVMVILGATHARAPKGFAALAIGLALTLIHLISIPISNTSVNPARSTGPAIFEGGVALTQLWAFWAAPILGAVVAGLVFRWLRPDVDETGADEPAPDPIGSDELVEPDEPDEVDDDEVVEAAV
jgi:aquaporin Z